MDQDERIERYILNKMDENEASEFEAYFLSNQACIEQLEIAEKLHIGLKALHEKRNENVLPLRATKSKWWRAQLPLIPSVAAMFLFFVLPFIFISSQSSGPNSVDLVDIELAGLRSNSADIVEVSRTPQQLVLSIYVDTELYDDTFSSFKFSMTDQQGKVVFKTSDLQLNDNSTVFINLGTQKLPNTTLQFEFSGAGLNSDTQILKTGAIVFK